MAVEITPALLEEVAVKLDDWGFEFDVDRTYDGIAVNVWIRIIGLGGVPRWQMWMKATREAVQEDRSTRAEREAIDQEAEQAWRTQ